MNEPDKNNSNGAPKPEMLHSKKDASTHNDSKDSGFSEAPEFKKTKENNISTKS